MSPVRGIERDWQKQAILIDMSEKNNASNVSSRK